MSSMWITHLLPVFLGRKHQHTASMHFATCANIPSAVGGTTVLPCALM